MIYRIRTWLRALFARPAQAPSYFPESEITIDPTLHRITSADNGGCYDGDYDA